jgi:DNA transformation protein
MKKTAARSTRRTPKRKFSLAVTPAFRQFVLDQLEEVGEIEARSMFGGVGLYRRALFFGIIASDVLYLKVDDTTRSDYEREGMSPFRPYPDRSGSMRYYAVPVGVLESQVELAQWVRKAVRVAGRVGAAPRTGAAKRAARGR